MGFCIDACLAEVENITKVFTRVYFCLGYKSLAHHLHGNRESPTRCQGNQIHVYIYIIFPLEGMSWFSAMLRTWVFVFVFPVVPFCRGSSRLAEFALLLSTSLSHVLCHSFPNFILQI